MTTVRAEIPRAFRFLFDPPLGAVRYRVAYGGRGSAKSWQFARALLLHGVRTPLRILCAREFQTSIRDSVHKLLGDQIDRLGLQAFYTVQRDGIYGANGTEFLFKGLRKDVAQIKSTEGIDVCWVEEAASVSKESWEALIPTVRKPGSEIWVTFNPDLESDPTFAMFVTAPSPRAIVRRVGYRDNPWLPDVLREEAEELRRRDPDAYANVWGGEPWTRSDAEVLAGKWAVEDFTPQKGWQGPYFGADYGFANDPAVLVRLWTADGRLYLDYDVGTALMTLDDMAREWGAVPGAKEHVVRADAARPETTNELRLRGFRIESAPKWAGSVEDGITHLRSYERIVIHPRCARAQKEARLWRYRVDPRTGDVLPQLVDAHNHVWDSARYGLAPLIRQGSRPRFSVA